MSVGKSFCVHAYAQTKWPTASKFGTEILKTFLRRPLSDFLTNRSRFFRMVLKYIFLDFRAKYSFISRFFASLCGSRGLQLLNLIQKYYRRILKRQRNFTKNRSRLFTEAHQNLEYLFGLQAT